MAAGKEDGSRGPARVKRGDVRRSVGLSGRHDDAFNN